MNTRITPELNAGSMADIAFLLLVFFLMTTTMDDEAGMMRVLPDPDQKSEAEILRRNVLEVWVNADDRIMIEGELVSLDQVTQITKNFILNVNDNANFPEKRLKDIPFFGEMMVSKQVISLQNDKETSYRMYLQVQNELVRAYSELRNDLSDQKFGRTYEELKKSNRKSECDAIKMIYPQRISEALPN
ncbi:biopolymer transporter ExbD [bacterium SCSIO 12643]|nr:biopolymer transporter ExbD [bacterium SCSIO 12643]